MKGNPPVSAMCLTYGRPRLLEEAIQSFLLQDYQGVKELVVLNDLAGQTLVCDHPDVRIVNIDERFATVGEKRNACAALAKHDILFVWDDDDLYLPWRIRHSVERLEESKGYYKSPRAWMLNQGQLKGPTTNLYHSASCFTRDLFERAGRYPHIGSGQDWELEKEFKKLISLAKDDFSLSLEELYYIYRWQGTGSYHLSGFGRDEGKTITGNQRVAEFVNRQVAAGKIQLGRVNLTPAWKKDYPALVRSQIATQSSRSLRAASSVQQPASPPFASVQTTANNEMPVFPDWKDRSEEQRSHESARNTDLPLISCVMPTYGRPELVHESVAMFLAQDYENKELLIVNDCSGQIFEGEFPQVRIINVEERFQSLGEKRNYAINQAAGDWIAVWDDDDVYLPWRLSFSMREIIDFQTPLYRPYEFWAYWGDRKLHHNQAIPGWISHPLMIFHRDLWKAAGGYPHVTLNEDSALFQKMHKLLRTDWLTYPVGERDRFAIMRGVSMYSHTSIQGGKLPPNTTPGTIPLSPREIQDPLLRDAAESLIEKRSCRGADQKKSALPHYTFEENWFENLLARDCLDDLPTVKKSVGFGSLGRHGHLGYERKHVAVQGRRVRRALSTHAPATLVFRLDGQYARFTTRVAINDDVIGKPTRADFFVLVDGNVAACATEVFPGETPRCVEVAVKNAQTLELQVRTDRWDHCHAVWIEPTLWLQSDDHTPQNIVVDCLNRAKVSVPDVPQGGVNLCIATVASPGYEDWLETFLASLSSHGDCDDALIAVFCFGTNAELERMIESAGAILVRCEALTQVNMASKSVLYSVGKIIPARKYLCFDADMLVLGSLREAVSALDVFPQSSVLICRDSANIPTLGDALTGLYASTVESLKQMAGESAVKLLDDTLVINDGFFAATRPAMNAVDEVIRGFEGAGDWIREKSAHVPWRNQFVFNLALSKLRAAVEIDQSMNWQLNQRHLDIDEKTGIVQTNYQGNPLKIVHFNGAGRNNYRQLREAFLKPPERAQFRETPLSNAMSQPISRAGKDETKSRFVICSALRTGSHMLATALSQHPDLNVAGEILQRPGLFGLGKGKNLPSDERSLIEETLEKFNGCIIHRQHIRAMEHLAGVEGLKIIFLTRQNWLAQLASEIRARRTNVWHVAPEGANYLSNDGTSKLEQSKSGLTIPLERCFQYLREQTHLELITLERLSRNPLLVMTYEDLHYRWNSSIERVLEFLALPHAPLNPTTRKQGLNPHQVVLNYDEIHDLFTHTRWELAMHEREEGERP